MLGVRAIPAGVTLKDFNLLSWHTSFKSSFRYQLFVKPFSVSLLYPSHPPPLPEALVAISTYIPLQKNPSLYHIYLYPHLLCLTESSLKIGLFLVHLCVLHPNLLEYSLSELVWSRDVKVIIKL